MTQKTVEFEDLVGLHVLEGFECNRFRLGGRVFEAIEDDSDHLRTCLGELVELPASELGCNIHPSLVVECRLVEESFHGLEFTQGEWLILRVGTEHTDDYYPCFTCRYSPPGTQRVE